MNSRRARGVVPGILGWVFLALGPAAPAAGAELRFLCTDAMASSIRELVPQFEAASGDKVSVTVANAGTIAAMLEQGDHADVAIVLPPAWERLRAAGRIDPGVRVEVARVGLGMFVKRGAPRPDISSTAAFTRALAEARSVAVRDPAQRSPVGTHMIGVFGRLGLSEVLKGKLLLTAQPPYEEVIGGQADFGFSTMAEIAAEPRAELVGPLPADLQTYNVFTITIPAGANERQAADRFVAFLTADGARQVYRAKGLELP